MSRIAVAIIFLLVSGINVYAKEHNIVKDSRVAFHLVDLNESQLKFYHADEKGKIFKSFANLDKWLEKKGQKLTFGMNGGMYMEDSNPLGLYVENGKVIRKTNRVKSAYGNFYIQPNGVFFITKNNNAYIKPTQKFHYKNYVKYGTQSGPMLVIDGKINSKLKKGSIYTHIRNGVGVLPDGKVLFAISKELINFYDFAKFFQKNGCKNALYLDGAVSQIYLPPEQTGYPSSQFGVIIGEVN